MRPLIVLLLVLVAAVALIVSLQGPSTDRGDPVAGPEPAAPVQTPRATGGDQIRAPAVSDTRGSAPVGTVEPDAPAPAVGVDNKLVGRVLDETRAPLIGATVLLSRDPLMGDDLHMQLILGLEPKGKSISTKTNNKGEYSFKDVEPARDYYVIARHPEYSERQEQLVVVGEQGEFAGPDIVLKTGSIVFGAITDVGGNPVRQALLHLDSAFYSGEGLSPGRIELNTDNNGAFEIKNVSPGPRTLTIMAEGYGTVVKGGVQVNGTDGERVEVTVQLDVGQPIAGRVVSTDGTGVGEAVLKAFNYGNNLSYRGEAISLEDGTFIIENLHPGSYMLQVEAQGYRMQKATRVKVGEMSVEIVMIPQACVAGRVLDSGGAPVTNFAASIRRVSPPRPDGHRFFEDMSISQTFSGQADGSFQLCGLNPGSYVVVARSAKFAPTLSDVFSLVEGQHTAQIDVRLNNGGSIKGRVVGPGGTPVTGATVSTHDDSFESDPMDSFFENLMPTNITERKVRTDANGEFELAMLTPETYQVRVTHKGFTEGKVRGVVVHLGVPSDLGAINMQVGGTMRGTVFNQAGEGAARAFVHLESHMGDKTYSTRADAAGNYLFSNVLPGQYTLSATGVSTEGPQAINAIIDQRASQVEVLINDGREISRDLHIGG